MYHINVHKLNSYKLVLQTKSKFYCFIVPIYFCFLKQKTSKKFWLPQSFFQKRRQKKKTLQIAGSHVTRSFSGGTWHPPAVPGPHSPPPPPGSGRPRAAPGNPRRCPRPPRRAQPPRTTSRRCRCPKRPPRGRSRGGRSRPPRRGRSRPRPLRQRLGLQGRGPPGARGAEGSSSSKNCCDLLTFLTIWTSAEVQFLDLTLRNMSLFARFLPFAADLSWHLFWHLCDGLAVTWCSAQRHTKATSVWWNYI